MNRLNCFFAAIIILLLFTISYAEEVPSDGPSIPSIEERKQRLKNFDLALPDAPGVEELTPESKEKYEEALKSYYDYRISGYDHRMRLFEWQLLSSKIIFFVVNLLVFAGIYFAAVQFHSGLRRNIKGQPQESEEATEFVLTLKGFKVRSQVLGVIILTISLAFFYLYLAYVFPIENVF